jgi:hypothetical protein
MLLLMKQILTYVLIEIKSSIILFSLQTERPYESIELPPQIETKDSSKTSN